MSVWLGRLFRGGLGACSRLVGPILSKERRNTSACRPDDLRIEVLHQSLERVFRDQPFNSSSTSHSFVLLPVFGKFCYMLSTTLGKGKRKATVQQTSEKGFHDQLPSSPTSDSSSDSDSDSSSTSGSSSSDSDEEITPEYLESLLEKARQNAAKQLSTAPEEEEVIVLQKDDLECVSQ